MRIKNFKGGLLSIVVIVSIATLAIQLLSTSPVSATLTTHAPIYINLDNNFTLANGVVGGNGTAGNPYIIENWVINASSANGVDIENTTKYFIVRNCLVENGGSSHDGIYLYNVVNGKIENCACDNNFRAIYLYYYSNNNTLSNNTCYNNHLYGILLNNSCDNNTLSNNTCYNNSEGIFFIVSDNNNILSNNTCDNNNHDGICLYHSDNNTLSNNTCDNNYYFGIYLYMLENNNTLSNNTCDNNNCGIDLYYYSNNNILSNNTCDNNQIAINLYPSCDNNTLSNNTCDNNYDGICLDSYCDNNLIETNIVENNDNYGIYLYALSNNNTVSGNNVSNNYNGGICLDSYCDNNTLSNNTCDNNSSFGIYLYFSSDNNTITNNKCDNNSAGIYLLSNSDNNLIYHNNFTNNATQAYDNGSNYWDNGYPNGGNYWSDYAGVDINHGPSQNIPGSDGIGDNAYNIPGSSNQDHYPFMKPWPLTCTGTASLRLATSQMTAQFLYGIYKAYVNVNLTVYTGDNLHLIFLKYDNRTVEWDNVIWSRTASGTQAVTLTGLIVPHDNHLPYPSDYVKRMKLVLENSSGTVVLDNMAWYMVVQDDWGDRISWIVLNWSLHSSDNQDKLGDEISTIVLAWALVPSGPRDQHDFPP